LRSRHEIATPALLLDLDAFESNISRMAAHLQGRGRGFRPHGKTHKCPEIAKRLIAAGAIGTCAAKLSEAEVFAANDIRGLLVTTPVIGAAKIARAIELTIEAPDTIFCVDNPENVRHFNDAAQAAATSVALAVDLYFGRTGIAPGPPALELAQLIDTLPHVRFAGLQAYDGTAAHTVGFEMRRARTRETMARAVDTRRLIERNGIACAMVASGSTGTYNIDSEIDGITELQPGSFVFMDVDYSRIGGRDGATAYTDFRRALTVVTTVVSTQSGTAIVDGGYKSFSTDRPWGPEPIDLEGATYSWAGDEHGRLDLKNVTRSVKVGDRIEFTVPHCDPTVNLYDRIYAVRGDRVEGIWPIAARGMSQ
jgi:D-serine deaminase-like pyridoxal phosphate-dependent protein